MKRIFFFILMACASLAANSQSQWYYYSEEFYFVKEVPVKDYRGANFRYEIAVKAKPADTLSRVRIHGINVGKGQDDFINSDFSIEQRTEQDWTIYTIVGKIDENAWKLWFYSAVNGNGDFYFDDVSFYVETAPGQWKQLALPNSSFESKNKNIFDSYYVSRRSSQTLTTQISNTTYKTGQHALHVNSRKQQPVSLLTTAQE